VRATVTRPGAGDRRRLLMPAAALWRMKPTAARAGSVNRRRVTDPPRARMVRFFRNSLRIFRPEARLTAPGSCGILWPVETPTTVNRASSRRDGIQRASDGGNEASTTPMNGPGSRNRKRRRYRACDATSHPAGGCTSGASAERGRSHDWPKQGGTTRSNASSLDVRGTGRYCFSWRMSYERETTHSHR
jgi:hypothetical protein